MDFKFSYRKLLTLPVLIFVSVFAFAQNTIVTGRVIDATDRKPLPGVSVTFTGTTSGSMTNNNGEYRIITDKAVNQIKVSFLGYKDAFFTVKAGVTQAINVRLAPIASQLKE